MHNIPTGSHTCKCKKKTHATKLVVLTGGPGGGKTAVLEMARRYFCRHVMILPEAASIVFGGGFPRLGTEAGMRAAQRAIFRVEREMERLALESDGAAVILCDRGTVDGLAYWPDSPQSFFRELGTTLKQELLRYDAVVHVETAMGTDYQRAGLRLEPAKKAHEIDARIHELWKRHPLRFVVSSSNNFLEKAALAIELIRSQVPECCRTHPHSPVTAC